MKEHEDDLLPSGTESTATVDSGKADEIGIERGRIEGVLSERDEGEDVMVDVVGADVVVDDHGGREVDLDGKKGSDAVEGVSERGTEVCEEVCGDSDGSRVLAFEKVEVVVSEEGVKGNVASGSDGDAQKSGGGAVGGDSKKDSEKSSLELQAGGGEIDVRDDEVMESVQEMSEGDDGVDEKTGKEDEILESSEVRESLITKANLDVPEVDVVVVGKGLPGKDEADVDDQTLSAEVLNVGTGEGAVDVRTKNLDQPAEVDQISKEDCLHPTIEDATIDAKESGNGTRVGDSEMAVVSSGEPEFVGGEIAVRDEELERGLTEERVERPMESVEEGANVDHGTNEKTGEEDKVLVSAKVPESETTGDLGLEEADVVAAGGGLAGKDEAQDGVSEEPSLVCRDNHSLSIEAVDEGTKEGSVHVNASNLDQGAEVDGRSKEESSCSKTDVKTNDDQKPGEGTGVVDSKMADDESLSICPQVVQGETALIDRKEEPERDLTEESVEPIVMNGDEETERGSTEEIVKQPMESVQEKADEDHMMDEKPGKEDEVLDSSKIPELSTMANLGSEEADVAVVEEGLVGKDEAQDGVSVDPTSVCPDDQEKGEVLTSNNEVEGLKFPAVDECSKTGVTAHSGVGEVETNTRKAPNSEEQVPSAGGILVKDQGLKVDAEPESSIANKVVQLDTGVQSCKVELPTTGDMSRSLEDGGLMVDSTACAKLSNDEILPNDPNSTVEVPSTSEISGLQVSGKDFAGANSAGTDADYAEHGVLPADSKFLYEAHVDRGEDAGMDIDEVLGWKDDVPAIDGQTLKDKHVEIYTNTETAIEQELSKSCEQEENLKIRQSIVYERRVHVEVPLHDENSKAETRDRNLEEDGKSVQEEEQKVQPADPSNVDKMVDEDVEVDTVFCREDQETEALELSIDEVAEKETSISLHQSCYFAPPENEGEFSASDLVWGKVRSHPWWPGQIFDQSDASERAMKYHKKDSFLVAYFGDKTFAWNESSVLKPFRAKFSQVVKHINSESFKNAVNCALEEVSRRVELGLSCSCISHDILEKIEYQVVENAGIKQESSKKQGLNKSTSVSSFEPEKLVDYVKLLAKFPYDEVNKMEFTMAKAQLSSYSRYKGHRSLPEVLFCGNLLEDGSTDINDTQISDKKERSFSEDEDSTSGVRKRKAIYSVSECSEKRPTVESPTPKQSFKVGECIQRAASHLTGTPWAGGGDEKKAEQTDQPASPETSLVDMVSQLRLAAQDPVKGHTFLNAIIPFFYSHRSSIFVKSLRQNLSTGRPIEARKRKPSNENHPEDFEFDDVNDSYWTDRIIQNNPEEQPAQEPQNGGVEYQLVSFEQEKPVKPSRRSNKKRFFSSNHEIEAKEQSELIERRRQNLATEVLLKFTEGIYFPSEIHLNKMFKRFGPLMESETEVDRQSGRARVVFKKCSDAEVAHNSAGKFNIFGPVNVSYELNYNPLISYKPLPPPTVQDPANAG